MERLARKLAVHQLVRATISVAFATFIAYLVRGDYMSLYIAPRMEIYVKLAAIALYIIGVFQFFTAYRNFTDKAAACDCNHEPTGSVSKQVLIYSLFVLPLLLGFALPNTTLGTAIAAKKGMNLTASSSGRVNAPALDRTAPDTINPEPDGSGLASDTGANALPSGTDTDDDLDSLFVTDMYNEEFARLAKKLYQQDIIRVEENLFMEILTSLDLFMDQFQGKTIQIGGFIYRDPEMTDTQFVIARFAMECCSADSMPYGVLVEFDKANQYANDTWLQITAKMGKTTFQGYEIMSFQPISIEPMEQPGSPYVYPNYDF